MRAGRGKKKRRKRAPKTRRFLDRPPLLSPSHPLRVEHVVHRHHVVRLPQRPRPHAAQLLHVPPRAEEQAEVDAQGADVGAGLARDPEDGEAAGFIEFEEFRLVNGAHAQLALDRGDQRGALEQGTRQGRERARDGGFAAFHGAVEPRDAHILFPRPLLALDEAGGAVDAHDQVPGDLGVERARVACLVDAQDAADPGDDLVRGRVGGFVQVDDAVPDIVWRVEGGRVGGCGRKTKERRRKQNALL